MSTKENTLQKLLKSIEITNERLFAAENELEHAGRMVSSSRYHLAACPDLTHATTIYINMQHLNEHRAKVERLQKTLENLLNTLNTL